MSEYPPAYYRYQERNPVISVRLTTRLKDALDKWRGYRSYAEAIRELVESIPVKEIEYEHFTAPCKYCGRPMYFREDDEDWGEAKGVLKKAFAGWAHSDCIERYKR